MHECKYTYSFIYFIFLTETEQSGKKNHVKFNDTVGLNITHEIRQETLVINEQKIDRYLYFSLNSYHYKKKLYQLYLIFTCFSFRLLHLLHEANPTNESADTEEMLKLEGNCGPGY